MWIECMCERLRVRRSVGEVVAAKVMWGFGRMRAWVWMEEMQAARMHEPPSCGQCEGPQV